jgi:hypothetical protein
VTYSGYYTCRRTAANIFVHSIPGKEADLQEFRFFVNQILNAFARSELAFLMLFFNFFFATAGLCLFLFCVEVVDKLFKLVFVFVEFQICFSHTLEGGI